MTMTITTIDDTNLHNGAMIDPVSPDPEVLERSAVRIPEFSNRRFQGVSATSSASFSAGIRTDVGIGDRSG
jgi:hypothetical protein